MKKQKSSMINISEVSSSDDENSKPKIDKEDIKKYLKTSDDESSQEQITPTSSPQKPIKVKRLKTSPLNHESPVIKMKKVNKPKKAITQ